jgi:hypothetical protein
MSSTEFELVALSGGDPAGTVLSRGGTYYRVIAAEGCKQVQDLLCSNLLVELHKRGFIPRTTVRTGGLAEYPDSLVLEHEGLLPVSYPREWCFEMCKAAGVRFLELIAVLEEHGFTLKDSHLFNFVFHNWQPVWVDIGSIVRRTEDDPWPWLKSFWSGVFVPLNLWSRGAELAASRLLSSPSSQVTLDEAAVLFWPLLGGGGKSRQRLRRIVAIAFVGFGRSAGALRLIAWKLWCLSFGRSAVAELRMRLGGLRQFKSSTWHDYQGEYLDERGGFQGSSRLLRVIEVMESYRPKSVLELAGNSGLLSEQLARRNPQAAVVCTDYDRQAIGAMFDRLREKRIQNLSCMVLDFMSPEYSLAEVAPWRRISSDCVLALAVTHHLVLTQGYRFDQIFDTVANYTQRLLFVEFMPLGLHNGTSAPTLPKWYSQEEFESALTRRFKVLSVESLDENRVLYVAEIRSGDAWSK